MANLTGRAELLSALFFCISLLSFAKSTPPPHSHTTSSSPSSTHQGIGQQQQHDDCNNSGWGWLALSSISAACAMLCKEQVTSMTSFPPSRFFNGLFPLALFNFHTGSNRDSRMRVLRSLCCPLPPLARYQSMALIPPPPSPNNTLLPRNLEANSNTRSTTSGADDGPFERDGRFSPKDARGQ